jgi:ATP-dependent Clp protease ATP-binding subunit ClpA
MTTNDHPQSYGNAVRLAMQLAWQEAHRSGIDVVGTEHILVGLLKHDGPAAMILANLGVDLRKVRNEIERLGGVLAESNKEWKSVVESRIAESWQADTDPPQIVEESS